MPVNSFDDYPMSWKPDLRRASGPKYLALARMLEADIQNGVLKPGTRLPPQRELADFLDVNLSTVSRAFKLCGQKGLLSSAVGSGTFVSSGAASDLLFLCGEDRAPLIDLGAIVPAASGSDKVKQYLERLLRHPDAPDLFSYGTAEGTRRHREAGAAWLRRAGFVTDPDHIVLASGGQNALAACLGAFFQCGERIGTDPLTYPGVKTAARLFGIQLVPVELTESGLRYAVQNENIKGLYLIPDYHNPTARILPPETRQLVAALAQKMDLLVLEDGINSLLTGTPLPPVAAFAPENTVYLSSLSKTVSAGLRTAFVHVPERSRAALVETLYTMNICLSPLLATAAAGLIEEGIADEILAGRRELLARRNRLVDEIMDGFPAAGDHTSPLRFLSLPEHFTGRSFEICARQAGVLVYGAERFSVGSRPAEKAVRLSVATPPTEAALAEGLRRLRQLLEQ